MGAGGGAGGFGRRVRRRQSASPRDQVAFRDAEFPGLWRGDDGFDLGDLFEGLFGGAFASDANRRSQDRVLSAKRALPRSKRRKDIAISPRSALC